jgi:excinuclease ABC subunit C
MEIEKKLEKIPASPGVYIMKGGKGEVLYIGKAKSLRARVRSYFKKSADARYAVKFLATRARDIDYIVTATEKEALLLEDTLLKQHKPKYNIRLKDSKTYVSIKLTMNEDFPRILVTRQIKKDGSRYFGPYVSARVVRDTIKLLRRIFPLCVCSASVFKNMTRPCLDYQLGLCAAPAVGLVSKEAYAELVDGAVMFLEGKNTELVRSLKKKMVEAAKEESFEKAASIRDRLEAIEEMLEGQRVVSHKRVNQDVFAMERRDDSLAIQTMTVRDGRLVNSAGYLFTDTGLPDDELLSSFVTQYYRGQRFVPDTVLLPFRLDDIPLLIDWLTEKAGRKISVHVPIRGEKVKLIRMAGENAREAIRKRIEEAKKEAGTLDGLKVRLRLGNYPSRIEAFDISNLGGRLAVGAMVAFRDACPDKDSYRLFRIKGVEGPDDYAMMREVLERRYGKATAPPAGQEEKRTGGMQAPPDLILVDGGKGQLNITIKVLRELGITGVDVAALAKDKPEALSSKTRPIAPGVRGEIKRPAGKGERVFKPGVKDPIPLKEGSKPDLLLRRIRDEVHRFAIKYQRRLRGKEALKSALEEIPGIGPKKKKALFQKFGDLAGIKKASIEELSQVPGITKPLALRIKTEI